MKQHIFLSVITAMTMAATTPAMVQADNGSFSIMTLNVDGLPGKILFFDVNENGPKLLGSEAISLYMAAKDCDIVAMQENFNYRLAIWSCLFLGYNHDEWTGGVDLIDLKNQDYIHPQNFKLKCDGLNTAWKRKCQSTYYERVAWNHNFGKFSHSGDDLITKGFRRHEITLQDGNRVVVYNMHMDASDPRDVRLGNEAKDREARLLQWEQLRQHIMERLDDRPVLVVGDMNSYYYRDAFKATFIDAIQATGLATVGDAWVERKWGGVYPELGSEPIDDETLDKMLYINPTSASIAVTPTSVEVDKADYIGIDGKPLGDHYPLIVRFSIVPSGTTTGISTPDTPSLPVYDQWYSLQGTPQDANAKGISISRSGQKRIQK